MRMQCLSVEEVDEPLEADALAGGLHARQELVHVDRLVVEHSRVELGVRRDRRAHLRLDELALRHRFLLLSTRTDTDTLYSIYCSRVLLMDLQYSKDFIVLTFGLGAFVDACFGPPATLSLFFAAFFDGLVGADEAPAAAPSESSSASEGGCDRLAATLCLCFWPRVGTRVRPSRPDGGSSGPESEPESESALSTSRRLSSRGTGAQCSSRSSPASSSESAAPSADAADSSE